MLSMSINFNAIMSQEVQDEVDSLLVSATLLGYVVTEIFSNKLFSRIIYCLEKDNQEWKLILSFYSEGNMYRVTFMVEKSDTYITSEDLNEDFVRTIRIAKTTIL